MDFGGLDDILDDDIGYIPTAIKRQQKTRGRPASMSRQNSTQSIGSMKDTKQQELKSFFGNPKPNQNLVGIGRQSPKNSSFSMQKKQTRQPARRNTLFGAHKQTASIVQNSNNSQGPISFEQFFKSQSTTNTPPLSKPPLPDSRPPLPQKKIEKNSSFSQLSSPENIIDDDLNNSSMASRRGRPPLSRKNQNINNQSQIQQNKSQNFVSSKGLGNFNDVPNLGIDPSFTSKTQGVEQKWHQSIPATTFQQTQPINSVANPTMNKVLMDETIEQLKKMFSRQLQYQKEGFESLIKQQRQSHREQVQRLKSLHLQEIKTKVQIKEFELQKVKQFYELQLKIYSQRQLEIKQYSVIARKLEGNISTIQKLEKNMKDSEVRNKKDNEDQTKKALDKIQCQLKQRDSELKRLMQQLEQQRQQLRNQKLALNQSVNTQKARLYELEVDLRKRQAELQGKYKKLQASLLQQYQAKSRQIDVQRESLRMESLHLKEQRNIIEVEKIELINSRKLWDNQKKTSLEQLHQHKTKVLEKQIQIASRTGHLEIKEQEIQMHQNDYVNKLKLIQLEKKKLEIQKNNNKGQFYLSATSGALKTHGLLGTTLLNKTNQTALHKEFYSNDDYQKEPVQQETNYKKTITQMRDQFLRSLPKF